MTDKAAPSVPQEKKDIIQIFKNASMVILILIFVILYAAAFSGKLDPLKDNTMLLRLEPVIFILIGCYFGRLPGWQSEKTLKDEITRQMQKADAAQYAKEKALQDRETLEEKIRNTRIILKSIQPIEVNMHNQNRSETLKAAISVLDS